MTRLPIETARWILLLLIVLAPWVYGSTPQWVVAWERRWLIGMGVLFALGLLLQRRWPRGDGWIGAGVAVALLYGWGMALFPSRVFNRETFAFKWVEGRSGAWMGTYDAESSIAEMALLSGLCVAGVIAADLMANKVWLRRLWVTLGATGVSIAFLALLQRTTGAEAIFWERGVISDQKFFFGPYLYHANAGAYLNLVLPLVFGLIAIELQNRRVGNPPFTLWFIGAMVVVTAIFVNTSRAALVIGAILLLFLLGVGFWWLTRRLCLIRMGRQQILAGVTLAGAIGMLPWIFGWETVWTRWKDGMSDLIDNGRFPIYELIWNKIVPEAGLWGFGPGTFEIVFPFFSRDLERPFTGILKHAHHDYLQLLVEFGWIGALIWICTGAGIALMAVRRIWLLRRASWGEATFFCAAAGLALAGIFAHAAVDFPLQIASLQLYTAVLLGVLAGYGAFGGR